MATSSSGNFESCRGLNYDVVQGVRSNQAIAELMQSPQFHQQLDSFTQVLMLVIFQICCCFSRFSVFWYSCGCMFAYVLS
jgi:hypothetical protein